MKDLNLTQGKLVIIDDEDFERLTQFKWYWSKNPGYARRSRDKKYLHRFILGVDKGTYVDHKNGNPLDCRKENLRICTNQQNSFNSKIKNKLGFKGVRIITTRKVNKKYEAYIGYNKKYICLGYYFTPIEAAKAYDAKATELFGEFARLNFP